MIPAYTPAWSLHPSVFIGVGLLGALYFWRLRTVPAPWWRPVCFVAGLLVMLASLNGPIHDLSDTYLFSIHMAQHLLLTMVVPPLLIAAVPAGLLEPVLARPAVRAVARVLVHPVFAGAVFSATLLVWHTVAAYDLMMRSHGVHIATHLMFIAAAVLLWWPVTSSVPALPALGPPMGMLYLFLVQLPMQLLGAILTFSDTHLYTWYAAAPRTWGLSVLDDQKVGGLLMWVPGNLWIWGAMSVLFFRWAKQER